MTLLLEGLMKRGGGIMNVSDQSQKEIEQMVKGLASSGFNLEGKSILLDKKPKANQNILMNFMRMYDIAMDFFILCENVLRYNNCYNALRATPNLQDEDLERNIFMRLRDPEFFIDYYGLDKDRSKEESKAIRNIVGEGYTSFIDDLSLP